MLKILINMIIILFSYNLIANEIDVKIYSISKEGVGENIGYISIKEVKDGLLFTPILKGLPQGEKGFHIHEGNSCDISYNKDGDTIAGGNAKSHYDPNKTNKHLGPDGYGHSGDLPLLIVEEDGSTKQKVLLTKYNKIDSIKNLSIVIHQGGDNYSDEPAPLGGGGVRIACGVIE